MTSISSLLDAVKADQQKLVDASLSIANDNNSVATLQSNVDDAQAALDAAAAKRDAAKTQLAADSAALLPDAVQLQSDVNALVDALQLPPDTGTTGNGSTGGTGAAPSLFAPAGS